MFHDRIFARSARFLRGALTLNIFGSLFIIILLCSDLCTQNLFFLLLIILYFYCFIIIVYNFVSIFFCSYRALKQAKDSISLDYNILCSSLLGHRVLFKLCTLKFFASSSSYFCIWGLSIKI